MQDLPCILRMLSQLSNSHVQKRMGTALRKLKPQEGKQKLKDGKTIGGIGRLTHARIDRLQVYYRLAI